MQAFFKNKKKCFSVKVFLENKIKNRNRTFITFFFLKTKSIQPRICCLDHTNLRLLACLCLWSAEIRGCVHYNQCHCKQSSRWPFGCDFSSCNDLHPFSLGFIRSSWVSFCSQQEVMGAPIHMQLQTVPKQCPIMRPEGRCKFETPQFQMEVTK